jgi:hypothetical protein
MVEFYSGLSRGWFRALRKSQQWDAEVVFAVSLQKVFVAQLRNR